MPNNYFKTLGRRNDAFVKIVIFTRALQRHDLSSNYMPLEIPC
jgi:hypothetical protein